MGQYGDLTNPLIYISDEGPSGSYSVAISCDWHNDNKLIVFDGTNLVDTEITSTELSLPAVKEALDEAFDWGSETGIYMDGTDGATLTDNFQVLIL